MIGILMEKGLFVIERSTVTGRDPLGKPVTSTVDIGPIDGRLEQATTTEGGDDTIVLSKFRGFMPYGTPLRAGDRVRARGLRFEVDGAPSVEEIPGFPALANVAVTLRYVGPVM